MIKKLRRRFILTATISVAIVLFVIMGAINILNYHSVVSGAEAVLDILEENGGSFSNSEKPQDESGTDQKQSDQQPPDKPSGIQSLFKSDISPETPFESRYFTVTIDADGEVVSTNVDSIASVDESTADEMALDIYSSGKSSGFSGPYRYRSFQNDSGDTVVIFLDCQKGLSNARSFLLISLLVSVIGLVAVFVLIFFASKRVIAPAQESYEKQRRFITDAGHELKTPLTIIDADISVAEMDTGENEWLDDVKVQTKRLADLTNDLIYLSRMGEENHRLQMIDFPLSDIVSETANSFRSRAQLEEKNFQMDIEPMLNFCGDEASIRKLVSILLDNAIKYSSEKGNITLSLHKKDRGVELCVSNTTDSLDPEMLRHMFDRFYRADKSRNSSTGGYGLGLSIAQAVVSAHQGKITAAGQDENTLRITVYLPSRRQNSSR